jgi:hypothetical protein
VIVSFGADGKPGGEEEDADLSVMYKASLKIARVTWTGNWGAPRAGDRLIIQFNNPLVISGSPLGDLSLIVRPDEGGQGVTFDGRHATRGLDWGGVRWTYASRSEGTDEAEGRIVLLCTDIDSGAAIRITPGCAVDVGPPGVSPDGPAPVALFIHERVTPGGPLDRILWGDRVPPPGPAVGLDPLDGRRVGVPLSLGCARPDGAGTPPDRLGSQA